MSSTHSNNHDLNWITNHDVDDEYVNIAVTLSKTTKKGRGHKELIINGIRDAAEKYSSIYVFNFQNMRNSKLKEFREQLQSSSKFFLGSNKVMQVAIGRSSSDEIKPNLHKVSKVVLSCLAILFWCFVLFYLEPVCYGLWKCDFD